MSFTLDSYSSASAVTITAGNTQRIDFAISKSGWHPLSISGFDFKDGNINLINIGLASATTVTAWVKNLSASSVTITPSVIILWQRD